MLSKCRHYTPESLFQARNKETCPFYGEILISDGNKFHSLNIFYFIHLICIPGQSVFNQTEYQVSTQGVQQFLHFSFLAPRNQAAYRNIKYFAGQASSDRQIQLMWSLWTKSSVCNQRQTSHPVPIQYSR